MRPFQKLFWVFIIVAILFMVGFFFDLDALTISANYLLVPVLILYYRLKAKRWFLMMVVALFLFYIRDIFLFYGFRAYSTVIMVAFFLAILVLYGFAVTGFQKARVHTVEWISLVIMYGFLGFLFFTMADLVPQVMPSSQNMTFLYLFMITLLLAITFTEYLLKSHFASLWLMLASASLLVSELSLFFKVYVIDDISVKFFFPFFHVIAYYAMVEHALHRRPSVKIPYF